MVGSSENVRVGRIHSYIVSGLQEKLQAWLTVRGKDEGLDASTLSLDPDSGEVRENQPLKGGEGGLQRGESWRSTSGDGNRALRSHTSTVLSDGQLGDLALTSPVVENEERQTGVAEEAPGLRRLQLSGQGQKRRVLKPTEVQDQGGQR